MSTEQFDGSKREELLDEARTYLKGAEPGAVPTRRTIGAAVWAVLGGLASGSLINLAVFGPAVEILWHKMAGTYEKFPSLSRPVFATDFALPTASIVVLFVLGIPMALGAGLITVLLARSKDRWSDIQWGTVTGLFAGLGSFVFGVGQGLILTMSVVVALTDLSLLGSGYAKRTPAEDADKPEAHPQDILLKHYPDLHAIPEAERGNLLMSKIVADEVNGIFLGISLGLVLTLLFYASAGVCQTVAAGYLLRSRERLLVVLFPYLELTVPPLGGGLFLWKTAFSCLFVPEQLHQEILVKTFIAFMLPCAVLTALAATLVLRGWRWPLRLAVYFTWIALWLALFVWPRWLFDLPL